jgi:hypothetical protein
MFYNVPRLSNVRLSQDYFLLVSISLCKNSSKSSYKGELPCSDRKILTAISGLNSRPVSIVISLKHGVNKDVRLLSSDYLQPIP